MPGVFNQFQQSVGMVLSDWKGASFPQAQQIIGRYYELERINAKRHAKKLYEAYCESSGCRDWTYLAVRPFETFDTFRVYLKKVEEQTDPTRFIVTNLTNMKPAGAFAFMQADPASGAIEVGHVSRSVRMKRPRISVEAILLLSKYVFEDLGYRHFEWKCGAFNAPSRGTAERFGFSFEGISRQAVVTQGRNRDTAWYPVIDGGYPAPRPAYDLWLDKRNLDNQGRQIKRLGELVEGGQKLPE